MQTLQSTRGSSRVNSQRTKEAQTAENSKERPVQIVTANSTSMLQKSKGRTPNLQNMQKVASTLDRDRKKLQKIIFN